MRSTAIALLLLGCAGTDAAQEWRGVVDTLPNGAVRVSNPAPGLWREGTGWQLVPELELGESDGLEALMFSAISGLAVDDQGQIYVLDRQANELRIFSRAGKHVRTVGRAGGGPGEYANANGLLWLPPDTLLVVDQPGDRYTILTPEGEYVRSVPRQLGFYGWAFSGGEAGRRIYEHSSVGNGTEGRAALLGTSVAGDRDLATFRDTVLLPVPPAPTVEFFSIRTDRGGMMMGVPFAPSPEYYLDATGRIWHGHGSEFRIFRTSFAGDTIMELVVDAQAAPVTDPELAEWEEGQSVKRFRELGGRLDMDRIPKVKPFFDGLYRSPDGHLWVSVPAGADQATFAILDSAGRYLGRLEATGVRRYPYVPPVVRNDRLYVAGSDELDVPKVYVFRIEKRPR
ncbi:MAG TPA: 6-bladed beta-propeller [Gemmatimonadales bacterium]|nr:6-bladed beta-propeller [Gemmatimonadales bacterium]